MGILISWILNAFALFVTAYFVRGFHVENYTAALLAAVVIGFINAFIRPILLFLTAPLNLLTLGLFTFVINALVLWMASQVVPGLAVDNLWWAIVAAVFLTFISTLLSHLLKDLKKL